MILQFGKMMGPPGSSSPPPPPPPPPPTVFSPTAYTGNGSAQSIVTGLDLSTNGGMVWIKSRNAINNNYLFDTVRGAGNYIISNATNAQASDIAAFPAFTATGFDIGTGATIDINGNLSTYIAWAFAQSAGFLDIVAYAGSGVARTVAHALGAAPRWMMAKNLTGAGAVTVYTAPTTGAGFFSLNSTGAVTNNANRWNNTDPTSAVFSLGTSATVNGAGSDYIMYLFGSLPGVSHDGSYTGTAASLDIDCGFAAPARFVFIKRADSAGDFYMWDSARGIVSGDDPYLLANSTAAEVTNTDYVDAFATGFTVTASAPAALNAVGGTYVYLAIA